MGFFQSDTQSIGMLSYEVSQISTRVGSGDLSWARSHVAVTLHDPGNQRFLDSLSDGGCIHFCSCVALRQDRMAVRVKCNPLTGKRLSQLKEVR